MALDRWVAFIILCTALAYGYGAFFTMDQLLPPFMQRNPIWPSTFPKVLAVLTVITSLVILLGLEQSTAAEKEPEIDHRRLGDYHFGQAILLLGLMVGYALLLRPVGFLIATFGFLSCGALFLGERKLLILLPVPALSSGIWLMRFWGFSCAPGPILSEDLRHG